MEKINIMVGRFQPFTKGHYECLKASKYPSIICMVKEKSIDSRHPFPSEKLVELYKPILSGDSRIIDIIVIPVNYISFIADEIKKKHGDKYKIASWTCGSDRSASYKDMVNRYMKTVEKNPESNVLSDDFEIISVGRDEEPSDSKSDDNLSINVPIKEISATKVRNCLKRCNELERMMKENNDSSLQDEYEIQKKRFNNMIPGNDTSKENLFNYLKKQIQNVAESRRVKRNLVIEYRIMRLEKYLR